MADLNAEPVLRGLRALDARGRADAHLRLAATASSARSATSASSASRERAGCAPTAPSVQPPPEPEPASARAARLARRARRPRAAARLEETRAARRRAGGAAATPSARGPGAAAAAPTRPSGGCAARSRVQRLRAPPHRPRPDPLAGRAVRRRRDHPWTRRTTSGSPSPGSSPGTSGRSRLADEPARERSVARARSSTSSPRRTATGTRTRERRRRAAARLGAKRRLVSAPRKLVVNVDGGARGNPGPAAIAAVVATPDGESRRGARRADRQRHQQRRRVPRAAARHRARPRARRHGGRADRRLRADRPAGQRRVQGQEGGPEAALPRGPAGAARLRRWSVRHVRREDNEAADLLVNETLDARLTPPRRPGRYPHRLARL